MTNLMLCMGRRDGAPFEWTKLELSVTNIEELCFQTVRNRYVLDMESFNLEMCDWIEKECALPELASLIRSRINSGAGLYETAKTLLEYVRYNTQEEINETLRVLREYSELDIYEKHLARADYLVESEHYGQALDAYEKLMRSASDMDENMQEKLIIAEGVMNARMFNFATAAEKFREAYEMNHTRVTYMKYLAAMRMQMTEKEYLDFVSGDTKAYQLSMPLEGAISSAEEAYGKSAEHETIKKLMQYKASGDKNAYYALAHELTGELKNDYRRSKGAPSKD